jgi:hypothetical protein
MPGFSVAFITALAVSDAGMPVPSIEGTAVPAGTTSNIRAAQFLSFAGFDPHPVTRKAPEASRTYRLSG